MSCAVVSQCFASSNKIPYQATAPPRKYPCQRAFTCFPLSLVWVNNNMKTIINDFFVDFNVTMPWNNTVAFLNQRETIGFLVTTAFKTLSMFSLVQLWDRKNNDFVTGTLFLTLCVLANSWSLQWSLLFNRLVDYHCCCCCCFCHNRMYRFRFHHHQFWKCICSILGQFRFTCKLANSASMSTFFNGSFNSVLLRSTRCSVIFLDWKHNTILFMFDL